MYGMLTIHRLSVCYNCQTCLPDQFKTLQTSSIYYTEPTVLFSTTNCWFFHMYMDTSTNIVSPA